MKAKKPDEKKIAGLVRRLLPRRQFAHVRALQCLRIGAHEVDERRVLLRERIELHRVPLGIMLKQFQRRISELQPRGFIVLIIDEDLCKL